MVEIRFDDAAFKRLTKEKAEAGLRNALGEAESILKGDILNRRGTGRQYSRHRASAPGQPPAPDTGDLKAQTNADPTLREDGEDIVGRVVANSGQAEALERGTSRMAARPFLGRLKTDHARDLHKAFIEGAKR